MKHYLLVGFFWEDIPVRIVGMTLEEIAKALGGDVNGDAGTQIDRCAALESATGGSITFVENEKFLSVLTESKASAVVIFKGAKTDIPSIEVEYPAEAFAKVIDMLHPPKKPKPGIDTSAAIDPTAKIDKSSFIGSLVSIGANSEIGSGVTIHASVSVGRDCHIGRGSTLHPNVTLYDGTVIGERVTLHSGVVIGADGFKYLRDEEGKSVKVSHVGIVRIGNDVEIGANSCIDRAMLDETVIGNGVKIDNLVQIGHNCVIGDNTVIAGGCGISGSCRIGSGVIMGGQVGVADHVEIADGTLIAGGSAITGSIKKAGIYGGPMAAQSVNEWRKSQAAYRRGAETLKRLNRLEKNGEKE